MILNTPTTYLKTNDLRCGYNNKQILSSENIEFESGTITCLLGTNGSGKSTLLKTLSGTLSPLSGNVLLKQPDQSDQNIHLLNSVNRTSKISYVPQEIPLDAPFNVFDMVLMGRSAYLKLRSEPSSKDKEQANIAIQLLHIEHLKYNSYEHLSGGQKRLVIIARSIASGASVLLLDEPDSGLDIANRFLLWDAIHRCKNQNKIIVLSTHNPDSITELNARPLIVNNGLAELSIKFETDMLNKIYKVPFVKLCSNNESYYIPQYKKDRL